MNAHLQAIESPTIPVEEIARLHGAGLSLLPLGGGSDGKAPLRSMTAAKRFPLKQVLGPMYGRDSTCYGVRLDALAVIDCDENCSSLIMQMEARFGASPVHVSTPRGIHLYYKLGSARLPNLRGEGLPVDIKRGASSYVVGPYSVRPDGGLYRPAKGTLGIDDLPEIASGTVPIHTRPGVMPKGNRNRELTLAAINMVESVDSPDELFGNLAFLRDDECEDPASVPDEELRKMAEWAWTKRLEGKVYRGRDSEFRINRAALDALAPYDNASDAIALLVTLLANHGHIAGQTFPLDHAAMIKAGHTSLGRRRFAAAVKTLQASNLLGIAKEYSVGHSRRSYRLLRPRPDLPKVHSLFGVKEGS